MSQQHLEGVLPVWKPAGFTSHDVVAKVRRITGTRRIGHTGTLDPQVTGVLPLCIGRATRVVEYIQDLPKEYEAELTIGYSTDTEDATGTVTERVDRVELTKEQVLSVIESFVGLIQQVPPMYSAVKVDGKRLYQLAREGVEIERKARSVEIYEIEILDMDLNLTCPRIRFRAKCSKGTYVRTLCTDIGRALGYPAVMSGLTRTGTGTLREADCLTLEAIAERAALGTLSTKLVPADKAIPHIPAWTVGEKEAGYALQGRKFQGETTEAVPAAGLYRLYGPGTEPGEPDRFLGLFRFDEESRLFAAEKVFN